MICLKWGIFFTNGGYRYAVDYIDKKSILRKNKFKKENILFKKKLFDIRRAIKK